ncbi:pentapeptide repeat-containing protein [Runella sp.]|uniref:pentapeptide repeat-containing protein n=1 Tax=Runella sp. TaxID=1960881 RepID=UPI0030177D21
MTAQDLLAAYAAGVRDFSGRRLSQQANLNGAFLSEANLRGVRPEGVLDGVIEP